MTTRVAHDLLVHAITALDQAQVDIDWDGYLEWDLYRQAITEAYRNYIDKVYADDAV